MRSDFDPRNIKEAKNILLKELEAAAHIHSIQKEKQKIFVKKISLWNRIRNFFRRQF